MIRQPARVIACDKQHVDIEVERQSSCSRCQLKQGCGTGLLANHIGKRFSRITLKTSAEISPGQQIAIGIAEETLLQGAVLMYLLPLLCLFLFAAVAVGLHFSPAAEIFLGLAGLCVGLFLARLYLKTRNNFNIQIVEEKR